jgi:hypothetical protein
MVSKKGNKVVVPSGFQTVPDHEFIAINRNGVCINLFTGNTIKNTLNPDTGYVMVHFWLNGKTRNFYHHRLVALAFVDRPDRHLDKTYSELEVNHIDGNKSNNAVDNLEWVTPLENIQHAIALGLKYKGVLARNIRTNEISFFQSPDLCAKAFGISSARLRRHLESDRAGYVTKNNCVFKYMNSGSWPKLRDEHYVENSWELIFGSWFAIDAQTGQVTVADTLGDLAEVLGVSHSGMENAYRCRPEVPYQGKWHIRYDDLALQDALKRVSHYKERVIFKPKQVTATNLLTGEVKQFASRNIAGDALSIHPDRIRYAMKKGRNIVGDWQFAEQEADECIRPYSKETLQ